MEFYQCVVRRFRSCVPLPSRSPVGKFKGKVIRVKYALRKRWWKTSKRPPSYGRSDISVENRLVDTNGRSSSGIREGLCGCAADEKCVQTQSYSLIVSEHSRVLFRALPSVSSPCSPSICFRIVGDSFREQTPWRCMANTVIRTQTCEPCPWWSGIKHLLDP